MIDALRLLAKGILLFFGVSVFWLIMLLGGPYMFVAFFGWMVCFMIMIYYFAMFVVKVMNMSAYHIEVVADPPPKPKMAEPSKEHSEIITKRQWVKDYMRKGKRVPGYWRIIKVLI